MKKPLVAFCAILFAGALLACEKTIPDYSVDEAFDLMNDAIEGWLEAKSFVLSYEGTFTVGTDEKTETVTVKMTRAGTDDLIGYVEMSIVEPERWQDSVTQFEAGTLYVAKNENGTVTRTKTAETRQKFEDLYTAFLKTVIADADVRALQILVDAEQCTVNFEFDANVIDDTFYTPTDIDTVTFATVAVTFSHSGELLSLDVSYGTTTDAVAGTAAYAVTFAKLDRYVVIARLSASEKATYTEAPADEG